MVPAEQPRRRALIFRVGILHTTRRKRRAAPPPTKSGEREDMNGRRASRLGQMGIARGMLRTAAIRAGQYPPRPLSGAICALSLRPSLRLYQPCRRTNFVLNSSRSGRHCAARRARDGGNGLARLAALPDPGCTAGGKEAQLATLGLAEEIGPAVMHVYSRKARVASQVRPWEARQDGDQCSIVRRLGSRRPSGRSQEVDVRAMRSAGRVASAELRHHVGTIASTVRGLRPASARILLAIRQ